MGFLGTCSSFKFSWFHLFCEGHNLCAPSPWLTWFQLCQQPCHVSSWCKRVFISLGHSSKPLKVAALYRHVFVEKWTPLGATMGMSVDKCLRLPICWWDYSDVPSAWFSREAPEQLGPELSTVVLCLPPSVGLSSFLSPFPYSSAPASYTSVTCTQGFVLASAFGSVHQDNLLQSCLCVSSEEMP